MWSNPVRPSRTFPALTAIGVIFAGVGLALALGSCARSRPASRGTVAAAVAQTSGSCRECHEEISQAWAGTDHALANRTVAAAHVQAAFADHPHISDGGSQFDLAWRDNHPVMTEVLGDGTRVEHGPEFILGSKPLWQPLVPARGHRWQPTDMAYDVKRKEWFNVFGQENRRPGEWGHWTGRGMSWNSMCAQCHMTGFRKNYDVAADRYLSSWVEHGIGCIQCHGPMPAGHNFLPKSHTRPASAPPPAPFFGDRRKMIQTCAPCHARAEPITDNFQPGETFFDHYRLVLPVNPDTYYPDGQQRDEDFNWTSFLLSRMGGHAGVTCLDCHDPHSTKTLLPTDHNQLCLQCHAAPGRVMPGGIQAVAIDPLTHSHHAEGSTGNSCVACHMPTTNYMQRSPRHDHGWLIPDPLLHKELGIPDACSRCHTDKSVEWSIAAVDQWYGAKMDTRQRRRTRAIAEVQQDGPGATDALLTVWPGEDIAVWRATMLELLSGHADDDRVAAIARESLNDSDPIVRAAAVRLLAHRSEGSVLIRPLLADPVRLVRLDTEWALSHELAKGSAARRELDAYLALGLDQPTGRMRLGQDLANRGRLKDAVREMNKAVEWDPNSPGLHQALGLTLAADGNAGAAADELVKAADLSPGDGAAAQSAALALAEARRPMDAERYLRLAVERSPRLHRAWYNLGLLLAQGERLPAAIEALEQAERIAPSDSDYPSALATVYVRIGEIAQARAAATRALSLNPGDTRSRQILELGQP